MDVEDVSGVKQWMDRLAQQQAILVKANKRKGEKAKDRKPLDQLVAKQMMSYASMELMKLQYRHTIRQSFIAASYLPSVAPFEKLKKIFIKDLKLQTHHRGSYVTLRVATPAVVMTAVMAVLEDEKGDGVNFQLYHQSDQPDRPAEDAVKLESVCIIKEPYFKVMNDGGYGVRVDHVSDVIWLAIEDDRVPLRWRPKRSEIKGAAVVKEEGNAAIKRGKPREAVELYSLALCLATTEEESRIIKLNRSLANIKLERYDKALEDAGTVDQNGKPSEKGLYRAACALSGVGRFKECHENLEALLARFPECEPAKTMLIRIKRLLEERRDGEYNFKTMYEAAKATPPCLDNATYIGPVEVKDSAGRGRGLFARQDIAAGALLLCEKAFAYCFATNGTEQDVSPYNSRTALLMNTETKRGYMGTQADLITVIIQKLHDNPSLMSAYTSLYHGNYTSVKETIVDGAPIIDTFLVERIMSLNVFGCPRTSLENHLDLAAKEEHSAAHHTCGIFTTASYINHSCQSNASRSFIGDMQIVRASRDIPAGTEIVFEYAMQEPTETYHKCQERLANWGFRCACVTCEANKKTKKATIDRRLKLRSDLLSSMARREGMEASDFEHALAEIEDTYSLPAATVPRLVLWDPYLLLVRIHSLDKRFAHAITNAWKVLDSLGFVIKRENPTHMTSAFEVAQWGLVVDSVIETWVHLWVAYANLAPSLCAQCERYARIAYKIIIGEDETFDEHYGRAVRKVIREHTDLVAELGRMRL